MHLLQLFIISLSFLWLACKGEDSPGFFLKITKNVPRLGRRSKEYDSYFLKNSRVIPRIGRSEASDVASWLTNTPISASKRMMMSAAHEQEYNVVQPVNADTLIELLNRNAIPNEVIKFVHWKDFDRALQSDADLYAKVSSLGLKPERLREDLGFSSYATYLGNTNDGGTTYNMFYNKGDNDVYAEPLNRDLLQYNSLK